MKHFYCFNKMLFRGSVLSALILLLLTSCTEHGVISNFNEEVSFAHRNEGFFILDFMTRESDELLDQTRGWTRLTKTETRLGSYPKSQIDFILVEKRPLYLFLSCRPVQNEKFTAKSLVIKTNNHTVSTLALKQKTSSFFKITLPVQYLKELRNMLE